MQSINIQYILSALEESNFERSALVIFFKDLNIFEQFFKGYSHSNVTTLYSSIRLYAIFPVCSCLIPLIYILSGNVST